MSHNNIPSFEKERLDRINYLMSEIHNASNEIYEGFVDREYAKVKTDVTILIKHLKGIIDCVENEV